MREAPCGRVRGTRGAERSPWGRERPAAGAKCAPSELQTERRAERGASRRARARGPRALIMQTGPEAKPHAARTQITSASHRALGQLKKVDATAAMADMQPVVDQLRALEDARKDGDDRAARWHAYRRDQSGEALLAEAEAHQGRPAALLRDRGAAHPPRRRRSPARHEALSERRRRPRGVLSAAHGRRNSRRRACASRRCPTTSIRSTSRAPSASSAARSSRCST